VLLDLVGIASEGEKVSTFFFFIFFFKWFDFYLFIYLLFFFKAPKHAHTPQTPTRTALAHSLSYM